MRDDVIALVRATLNLDDLLNVIENVMDQDNFVPGGEDGEYDDEPCGFSEADCGSRWCEECGCLQYKRIRLKRAIAAAEALWPEVVAATRAEGGQS